MHHLLEGREWLRAALTNAAPLDAVLRARALTTEAALACLLGDFAAGEVGASTAVALAKAARETILEARARWIVAASRLSAGSADGVACELEQALTLFAGAATPADRTRIAYVRWTLGAAAFMRGDVAGGIAACERALAEAREAGSDGVTVIILSDFGGWLLSLGQTARARSLFEAGLSLAAAYPGALLAPVALCGLALVAAAEGDAAAAARRLGATEALRVRSGLVIPVHYRSHIDRAAALATEQLGAADFTALWEAGRADPDTIVAAASASETPRTGMDRGVPLEGLTQRERDVLRLLAAGMTDKEIAAALGIGRRTASSHVEAIRAKLGAPSRTAAVAIALRDRLV